MYAVPTYDFNWVRSAEELAQVADLLANEPIISVDTETSGWQTGNEQLCLIQIGVPSTKRVFLVDVLSTGAPLALGPMLASQEQLFIAHNAAFEQRQFARYDLKVRGIRDTLSMSRELRPDLPNHTLRTCCRLLLGIELSKEEQSSDWSKRPLSDNQIDYARLDAEVAIALYTYLADLEERVSAELQLDIPELMAEYSKVVRNKYELTAKIAHDLAFLSAREERVRAAIRQRLIDGASSYDGEFGICSLQKVRRTEVSPAKVREIFPEFADQVIDEHVDRKRFSAIATEQGLPNSAVEQVLDTVGFNERLTIKLKDEVGTTD
jgi:DNA polymerase III epsilon subunit-like protein